MLLSVQQKYILEVLRKLGCVRQDQLHALVRGKFPDQKVSKTRMEAMLRQLRSGLGDFHLDGNFVYLARDQPDVARLEAIDIMLELSEGAPQGFTVKVDSPRLLRFALGGDKLKLFSVAKLSYVSEPQQLQRERSERIVWISDSGTPPEGLASPPKHFFAARQEERLTSFLWLQWAVKNTSSGGIYYAQKESCPGGKSGAGQRHGDGSPDPGGWCGAAPR